MESMMGRAAALVVLYLISSCSKNRSEDQVINPSDPFRGKVESIATGFSFERDCSFGSNIVQQIVSSLRCSIDVSDQVTIVRGEENSGNPMFTIVYEGLNVGTHVTAESSTTRVSLHGPCEARSKDTPDPCYVELRSLTRGSTPAATGAVELGSSVRVRVACPAEMRFRGDDFEIITKQKPQRFEVEATDCVVE